MRHSLIPLAALTASIVATAPLAAFAQNVPTYATTEDTIRGTIARFDGAYKMFVNDKRGFVDNVSLHDGTIINPTGLRLVPGMTVTVSGHADGATFRANEIDTPYHQTYAYGGPYPYRAAYPFGWGYGPGYGYYPGFYPSANIGLYFGGPGYRRW